MAFVVRAASGGYFEQDSTLARYLKGICYWSDREPAEATAAHFRKSKTFLSGTDFSEAAVEEMEVGEGMCPNWSELIAGDFDRWIKLVKGEPLAQTTH